MRNALEGISELRKNVDTLIVIPNERLLDLIDDDTSLIESFRKSDEVLRQGVQGISELIIQDALIKLDFADVRTVMLDQGIAHMGVGRAVGKKKTENAAEAAINSPLLETTIRGAKAVIINFTGDSNLGLKDINAAARLIRAAVEPDANVIFGATINEDLKDEVMVTVIATGLDERPSLSRHSNITHIRNTSSVPQPAADKESREQTQEEDDSDNAKAKGRDDLRPIRELESDTPFEIPIFLQKKRT